MLRKSGQRKAQPPERCAAPNGWVRNRSLVSPGPLDAAMMINLIPTATGCRARGGSPLHATLDDDGTFLTSYSPGSGAGVMFAATAESIYDVTAPADATIAEAPLLTGFTSGDWASQQFTTAGGTFMWFVNGADNAALFSGTDLLPITGAATNAISYDGLSTDFEVGETLTGGTSGATATIVGVTRATATTGTLYVGTIAGGPYQNDEALTSASGAAVADGANSVALANTLSGVDGADLSHVWSHAKRLWFVEKDTLNAWYLGAGAISGTATVFPLAGVFQSSGALLFGTRLSSDSGEGMDDRNVFVSADGEVAVYTGTNPNSAATWALEGVYKISPPLGKRAFTRSGGDVWVATEAGLVSLLAILAGDADVPALSFDIEDYWQGTIAERTSAFPFSATRWHSRSLLLAGVPAQQDGQPVAVVMNTATKRWAQILGWDVRHSVEHAGRLYFTTASGQVRQADTTGTDNGEPYYSVLAPMFRSGMANSKFASMSRVVYQGAGAPLTTLLVDFDARAFDYPAALTSWIEDGWGSGVWGEALWGSAEDTVSLDWQATPGYGYSFTPALVAGWGSAETPSFEPIVLEVIYEVGREM